jgi:hypothetical protein
MLLFVGIVWDSAGCFASCFDRLPVARHGVEIDLVGMTEDPEAALHAVEVLQARLDAQQQRRYFNLRTHLRLVAPTTRDQ